MINKVKVRLINGKYYSYLQQQISTNLLAVELITDESGETITDEDGISLTQEGITYEYKALVKSFTENTFILSNGDTLVLSDGSYLIQS